MDAPDLARGVSAVSGGTMLDSQFTWSEPEGSDAEDYLDESSQPADDPDFERPLMAELRALSAEEALQAAVNLAQQTAERVGLSEDEAWLLLRNYKWDGRVATEAWYDNEERTRSRIGLALERPPPRLEPPCPICAEDGVELFALECGHAFCVECWPQYLASLVSDGSRCLDATCPEHKCGCRVPVDVLRRFLKPQAMEKHTRWRLNAFVQDSAAHRWCPSVECGRVLEYYGSSQRQMSCPCGFLSCWDCGDESHAPASCEDLRQWNERNQSEAENVEWILVNTRPCPKCKGPIEKNQGCNHMTCNKGAGGCGFEFCWICLQPWGQHGYDQCNRFQGEDPKEKKKKDNKKQLLDRYAHFYERYMNQSSARGFAEKQMITLRDKVTVLDEGYGIPVAQTQFLISGLEQVIECRRVLKWTYVYGFYLAENDPSEALFGFLQIHLDENTDALHELIEKRLDELFPDLEKDTKQYRKRMEIYAKDPAARHEQFVWERDKFLWSSEEGEKFTKYRGEAMNFTSVTKKFTQQIVADIASGSGGLKRRRTGPSADSDGEAMDED